MKLERIVKLCALYVGILFALVELVDMTPITIPSDWNLPILCIAALLLCLFVDYLVPLVDGRRNFKAGEKDPVVRLDSFEETYKIDYPVSENAFRSMLALDKEIFDTDTTPHDVMREVRNKNKSVFHVLTAKGSDRCIGYADIYPLKPEPMQRFTAGLIGDFDFTADMIVDQADMPEQIDCVLSGFVVIGQSEFRKGRRASTLLWAITKALQKNYAKNISIYAVGWSESGEKLLKARGFALVQSAKDRTDDANLYCRDFNRNDIAAMGRVHEASAICEYKEL